MGFYATINKLEDVCRVHPVLANMYYVITMFLCVVTYLLPRGCALYGYEYESMHKVMGVFTVGKSAKHALLLFSPSSCKYHIYILNSCFHLCHHHL